MNVEHNVLEELVFAFKNALSTHHTMDQSLNQLRVVLNVVVLRS